MLPILVSVGPFRYVLRADAAACQKRSEYAYLNTTGLEIVHDPTIAPELVSEALLHETLHAIAIIYAGDRVSEANITALSYGLFQVLQDNPDLINFVTRFK